MKRKTKPTRLEIEVFAQKLRMIGWREAIKVRYSSTQTWDELEDY